MLAHNRPDVGTENKKRHAAAGKVLLIFDVLIRRDHDIEAIVFRSFQQLAVL